MIENNSNNLNIDSYYKIINETIYKYNDILDSILEDTQEKENENEILRKELLQVIENKILKLKDRELELNNQKIQLLGEIDSIILELDLQPSLFTIDNEIKIGFNQLINSFNTTKLISSQIVLIESYHLNLKHIYNQNQNQVNQLFNELNQLYCDLGINEDKDKSLFKEIGLPSNKRISEIKDEIKRLNDIKDSIIDKINESKSSVIKLKEELELSKDESNEINNILNQLNQFNNSNNSSNNKSNIKILFQILNKLESINKELVQLKSKRINQISKLSNNIDKDYIQLGIDSNDELLIKFKKERDSIISNYSSVSLKLINCLLVESERLLELKKLKFKDQFDSKLKILENLWEQLCIPKENRNLKSIINQKQENNSSGNENDLDQDNTNGNNLDIENNNSYYYNLETLELVNNEIEYLTGLLASMKLILEKVKRREWIKSEMKKFENSASDSNRFKGSSVRLLEEAKFRKTISREFPKLTEDLVRELADWESQNDKRFFYYGQPYLDLMNSETERPDFDLLHLKLLTKKDHISESTSNGQVEAVSYINIDNQQKSNNKTLPVSSTPSKKPNPLVKRPSLSSIQTSSTTLNKTTTTTTTTSPSSKLSKTLSSINFSTTTSSSTIKSSTLKPSSSPSSLSTSTNSLTNTPSKPTSSSSSSSSNNILTPLKKEASTKSLHSTLKSTAPSKSTTANATTATPNTPKLKKETSITTMTPNKIIKK